MYRAAHGQVTCALLDASPGVASLTVPPPFGVARNGSGQAAPVRGVAQNGSGQADPAAALPRMAQDRLLRSAAPPGMGRDRLPKLVRSPRSTPSTLSQPRRGIFETASSFTGELTNKGREPSHQDLAERRGFQAAVQRT